MSINDINKRLRGKWLHRWRTERYVVQGTEMYSDQSETRVKVQQVYCTDRGYVEVTYNRHIRMTIADKYVEEFLKKGEYEYTDRREYEEGEVTEYTYRIKIEEERKENGD